MHSPSTNCDDLGTAAGSLSSTDMSKLSLPLSFHYTSGLFSEVTFYQQLIASDLDSFQLQFFWHCSVVFFITPYNEHEEKSTDAVLGYSSTVFSRRNISVNNDLVG